MTLRYHTTLVVGLAFAALGTDSACAWPLAYTYSDPRFNGNGHLLLVDLATGETTDAGWTEAERLEALCFGPDGTLYGLTSGASLDTFLWDLTTRPGEVIGRDTFSGRHRDHPGMAYDPASDRLWTTQAAGGSPLEPNGVTSLYRLNPANGDNDRSFTWPTSRDRFFDSLAINAAGEAFAADFANAMTLYRVDFTNGEETPVGPLGIEPRARLCDLSFDKFDRLWAIAGRGEIYRIDTTTGAATHVSTIDVPDQMWTTLAAVDSPPQLRARSQCPKGTRAGIRWANATPGGRVAIFFAPEPGEAVVPPSHHPCSGTQLALARENLRLAARILSDAEGEGSRSTDLRPQACGGWLQLLDETTCGVSAIVQLD